VVERCVAIGWLQCGECSCSCNCQTPECNEINCCCCQIVTTDASHAAAGPVEPAYGTGEYAAGGSVVYRDATMNPRYPLTARPSYLHADTLTPPAARPAAAAAAGSLASGGADTAGRRPASQHHQPAAAAVFTVPAAGATSPPPSDHT